MEAQPIAKGINLVKLKQSRYLALVTVTVNGEERVIGQRLTVAQLLAELDLLAARVAVEINCEVVPREQFAVRHLTAGDRVEVVHFVGGGC